MTVTTHTLANPTTTVEPTRPRLVFLDNLRTFMIALVVLFHAGLVYESSGLGATFWIVDDPATNDVSGLVNLVLDIFVMPTIFWIAGFFAPLSLASQGGRRFLIAKAKRLLVPWLLAVMTLVPLYKVLFLASRGLPQESWTTYLLFNNGDLGQSWLWFLPVLFLFNGLYWLGSRLRLSLAGISVRGGILVASSVGFGYSLAMDLLGWRGWTKLGLIDFQSERLLIYFLVFLVGALCAKRRVFDGRPKLGWLYHGLNATAWIPTTVYILFLLIPLFKPGVTLVSPVADRLILWATYHLALFAFLYGAIVTFWRFCDHPGPWGTALGRTSYPVYIVHTVVLGAVAMLLLPVALPSLVKYLLLAVATFGLSHLVALAWGQITRAVAPDPQ